RLVRLGRPTRRFDQLPKRVEEEATVVLGQRKLLQRWGPGVMHAFIFWGFLILLTTIAEAIGEVFNRTFAIPLIGRSAWLGLIQDVFTVLVIVGIEMAVYYRKVQRPERFKGSHLEEADFILLMIMGIMLTLLALNGAKIAYGINESPRAWTPVSHLVSLAFTPMSAGAQNTFVHLFLWGHIVLNLRDHLFEEGPKILAARSADQAYDPVPLNPGVIEDEVIWDCTTCGACMQECPVDIEHVDHIIDMRRNLVMAESRFPQEAGLLLRNLESSSNPWGQAQASRAAWADGLGVRVLEEGAPVPEYVYWVGCAGSFDDRAKKIAQAVVRVLQKAAVPFAILGPRELCNGDPARRMGNEYLFQELARKNVETLNGQGVTKIVANCPHCFNTLKNEYPDFGGQYEVIHHTELFARLMKDGRLRPTEEIRELLTYHDPCYIGRHNGVY